MKKAEWYTHIYMKYVLCAKYPAKHYRCSKLSLIVPQLLHLQNSQTGQVCPCLHLPSDGILHQLCASL